MAPRTQLLHRGTSLWLGVVLVVARIFVVDCWNPHDSWPVAGARNAMLFRNQGYPIACAASSSSSSSGKGDRLEDELHQIDREWEAALRALERNSRKPTSRSRNEPDRLRSASMLYDTIRTQGFEKFPRSPRNPFRNGLPIDADTYTKLQDILGNDFLMDRKDSLPETGNANANANANANDQESDENGIFLDAETYLEYSNMELQLGMGMVRDYDGRETKEPDILSEQELQHFIMPPEAPYKDIKLPNGKEPNFQHIINMKDILANQKRPSEEEEKEIYERVFGAEKTFFEQNSDIFREGLTNKTAAIQSTKKRRSSKYQTELLAQLNKLEEQIQEFEKCLKEKEREQINALRDEAVNANKKNDAQQVYQANEDLKGAIYAENYMEQPQPVKVFDAIDEEELTDVYAVDEQWILVDDPSTGEAFYWNSETGEMRYDLEHDESEALD